MKVYPEDIVKAVERSRQIAEDSKRLIKPAEPRDDGPFAKPLHPTNQPTAKQ